MTASSRLPTAQEQYLLELANQLRMDPLGEYARLIGPNGVATEAHVQLALSYFGVSTAAFQAQMARLTPAAPLAWNTALTVAADKHNALMIKTDTQAHILPGEMGIFDRVVDAGYAWQGQVALSENVYAYAYNPLFAHAGFVIDWGYDAEDMRDGALRDAWQVLGDGIQDPAGHRDTLMNPRYTEIGISMVAENNSATEVGPWVLTQDLGGYSGYQAQLLGVVINDRDGDGFYDIGEGLGGVTILASGANGRFTTTSWGSGGYQMQLPAGTYTIRFQGGSGHPEYLSPAYTVTIGAANVKLDGYLQDRVTATPLTLSGTGGADLLQGGAGADVIYGDGFQARYAPEAAATVFRLYQATLDRVPDAAGYLAWTQSVSGGAALAEIVPGFVGSVEFQTRYGALNDADFVQMLYQNVLGRAADPGGFTSWTGHLAQGMSRVDVVLGFAQSAEFIAATAGAAAGFADARDPASWADDVYRLYRATLDRAPDAAGFADWTAKLSAGLDALAATAGFVDSPEFQLRYGALNDADFIRLLYRNVLDRAPDAAGLADWTDLLSTGTSRAAVVQGFAQSVEFAAATAADLKGWIRALGQDDVLIGGFGENRLYGGALTDAFVFDAVTDGTHRVMDLEAWDYLRFDGFGYDSMADLRAHLTQVAPDQVEFADQGVVVRFAHTTLAQLTDDMFLF